MAKVISDLIQKYMGMRARLNLKSYFLIEIYYIIIDLCSIPRSWNEKPSFFILRNNVQTDMIFTLSIHFGIYNSSKLFIGHEIIFQYLG